MAKQEMDYEKQYQEDLERAQALSLESLALEQFRKNRLKTITEQTKNVSGEHVLSQPTLAKIHVASHRDGQ